LTETQGEDPTGALTDGSSRQVALDRVRTEELQAEREGSAVAAKLAQAEAELSTLVSEIRRERSSAFLQEIQTTPPPPITVTERDLLSLTARLAQLGEIDPLALKEYEETADRYTHLQQQLRDIETTYHKTQQLISTLHREMNVQFRQQFTVIHEAFRRHIKQLFEGGEAELTIVASTSEEAEDVTNPVPGIEITVHPPGKKPQHVGLLSGGEKALTSLALLFAILEVQQPPFLVLDEVDAALDEANSFRFAELLREKSQSTQCIVISHNRETMGHADVLYGITMQQDGVSRSYSVQLQEMSHTEAVEEMSL
ncbi:MAG: AAA family ATPase, partial [Candidatus Andersenbacteria bacterium]